MNNQFNSRINWQPFNNQSIAIQAQNTASSSAFSTFDPRPQSAVSRADQIGKENFPVHANAQMPYVNLSGGMASAEANNKIQKQGKTRVTAQQTQQVSQSVLSKKKTKKVIVIKSRPKVKLNLFFT
ncbi:hypothetical protein PNK_1697 [Candidatus Protochlamydia naegleriophila]|uniref:Uncharacterized protein n=1 Tax=Candidatus Protochlamydia naegleriophila TaxID=389348 RepID=A0A0U5JER4_9BACT|nr:hypothetical protein [Candidatus Protochlamydia naegleriophila]CUI17306.1 hypothetical protein PNK_1697 [Candidatus Protochlamydia naegleriophila]